MDSTLFYLLVGTGIVSVLTVIYVLVDERARIRAYEKNRPPAPPEPEPAAAVTTPAPPEAASLSTAEVPAPHPENPENPA